MTSFNTAQMETDRLLAPVQMEAAARKNEGIRYVGQSAMQAVSFMQQKVESDVRIAAFQQEQQLNAYKLQQVMALDQIALSRHGTTMAGLQVRDFEMTLAMKEEAQKGSQLQHRKDTIEAGLMVRQQWDESTGGYKPFESEDEYQKALKAYQDVNIRTPGYSPGLERTRLLRDLKAAKDLDDMKTAEKIRRRLAEIDGYDYVPEPGTDAPLPKKGAAAPAQPAAQPPNERQQFVSMVIRDPARAQIASAAFNSKVWESSPTWSRLGADQPARELLSAAVADSARMIVGMQSEGHGRDVDPAYASQYAMQVAESDPTVMAFLLWKAKDSAEDIQQKLEVLFPGRKGAVDYAVKQIPSFSRPANPK